MVFLQASIEFELVRSMYDLLFDFVVDKTSYSRYEAVVLGSFLILLMNLMGGQDGAVALLTGLPSDMYFNAPPLCCCCCCFCPEVRSFVLGLCAREYCVMCLVFLRRLSFGRFSVFFSTSHVR